MDIGYLGFKYIKASFSNLKLFQSNIPSFLNVNKLQGIYLHNQTKSIYYSFLDSPSTISSLSFFAFLAFLGFALFLLVDDSLFLVSLFSVGFSPG